MYNKKDERSQYETQINELKMSLVPLPCQESQLPKDTSSTQAECPEWLTDLADKFNVPIWSRRLPFNTSTFTRNLPITMVKNYHVEIKNRLWSIFGKIRKCKPRPCDRCCKPYLGVIVIGLCAARIFRLSLWQPRLLNEILRSGEKYFRQSFKEFSYRKNEFDLEDLSNECSLQGVNFKVFFQTVQQGHLYSTPLDGRTNLSFALLNFFKEHHFGILECSNRYLGFGFIEKINGGYFMFDAQSMNYPIFCMNRYAPFLLRTNHLQVLVYCLTIALNVRHLHVPFALHSINITITSMEEEMKKCLREEPVREYVHRKKRILPKEYWDTPLPSSEYSEDDLLEQIKCGKDVQFIKPVKPADKLEHRLWPSQIDECLGEFKVTPLVEVMPAPGEDNERKEKDISESEENEKRPKDFVRMICSYTEIPYTPAEEEAKISRSFVGDLSTILATGCAATIQSQKNVSSLQKRIHMGRKVCH